MGCGCAERREAIIRAAFAVKSGDMETVAKEAAFVVTSTAQDARSASAAVMTKAGALLALRRR